MISNEKIIYEKLVSIYPNNIKPITQLSMNTTDNKIFIESSYTAFDFDTVENLHIDGTSSLHSSPDSLFLCNDILYFIEFKEGKAKSADIRSKIHEALSTLFNFCLTHIPNFTKEDFFSLRIRYAVFLSQGNPASFLDVLETSKKRFSLKNLEGYLLNKSSVVNCPHATHKILTKLSSGQLGKTTIYNRDYPSTCFN